MQNLVDRAFRIILCIVQNTVELLPGFEGPSCTFEPECAVTREKNGFSKKTKQPPMALISWETHQAHEILRRRLL